MNNNNIISENRKYVDEIISSVLTDHLFEINDKFTRESVLNMMESVVAQIILVGPFCDYKVVCD